MSKQSRTVERRKARERQRRRNRQLTILGVLIVVVIIAVVLAITANQPVEAPTPENLSESYEGLERSTSEDGFARLGDSDAPVRVVEISSFDCPHCREFHEQALPTILDRVREGDIIFTYVPFYGTGGIPNGEGASRAAICAGEQDHFWEMHTLLFDWAGQFGNPFVTNRLTAGIENLGLDSGEFNQCFNSSRTDSVINAASQFVTEKRNQGDFTGTPSVYVNGVQVEFGTSMSDDVEAAIDRALAMVGPSETPEVTPEATPEVEATAEAEVTPEATEQPEATEDPGD